MRDQTVRRIAGKRLARTTTAVRQRGFLSVLAVTVAPIAPFPVVGLVAGAVRMRLRDYVPGLIVGMAPGTLATTLFANQIEIALQDPDRINYWVVAGVLLVLIGLTVIARRWLTKMEEQA
jgi:uncharacterized membrane protein YdjX (TVP38/TMEM64 family)